MRYQSFIINNYKGINELRVDLKSAIDLNVFSLVGLNESGKTTILEAIDWFYSPQSYDAHDLIPKSELANFNGKVSVKAIISLTEDDEKEIAQYLNRKQKKFILSQPVKTIDITREYEYKDSKLLDTSTFWSINLTGKTNRMKDIRKLGDEDVRWKKTIGYIWENMIPPIVYYENFLFDFPDKIYLELNEGIKENRQDIIYKEVIQDILNSLKRKIKIEKHLVNRYKSNTGYDRSSMENVLDKLASKITTEVFTAWKDLLKMSGQGMQISSGHSLSEDDRGVYIQLKVKEGDQTYHIRERSLGFRWFFAFVLFTVFRSYRDNHRQNALFLLDEPASNLHPAAQTKLLSVFDKLPNNQKVVYSTHSHHMINPKWLAGAYVVKNEGKEYSDLDIAYNSFMTNINAEKYFRFVAHSPKDTDYFRPIMDALDYQPSPLELTPEVIIVEGKNDYYNLKYLNDLGYTNSKYGDYIYPSTGKDKTEYIVSLYLGWGRNFIVILDDDRGGRATYNRLIKEYGELVENRIFRLVHIDKKWKGYETENLFTDEEHSKIMHTIYPDQKKYDKGKFNTALQNLLVNEEKMKLHKYTVNRFKKVFDFIDTNLSKSAK